MATQRTIGLDIGTHSIKMVEIDRSKKKFELAFVGIAYLPFETIVEKSIKDPDRVKNAIKALYTHSGSRTKQVCISLAGKSVIVRSAPLSIMTDEQLESQIQMEAEPYIPYDIKDVNIDFFIAGNRPDKEGQMDVVFVAARRDFMDEYTNVVKGAGLQTVVVDVDPYALEEMFDFSFPQEQEEIVAIINIGASTTNINILQQGTSKYTRDLPIGGESVTREIMRTLDVKYERAENIKRGAELHEINTRTLRRIFQRAVDSFIAEANKIMDFYATHMSYDPVSKIFLCGGGAKTYGLEDALRSELGIPVELVHPFAKSHLHINSEIFDPDYLSEIGPQMAVAVGLANRHELDKVKK